MSKIKIFDPAMCCSTGVCGPIVNPQLLRVSTVINNLKGQGIIIERYSLNNNPQAFVDNMNVSELIKSQGINVLPITTVDNEIVKTKEYLTNEEFAKYLNIKLSSILNNNNRPNLRRK
ncbi:MAG: arsD [Clostridia bacterium]|jgi:hypothetical protein|nr:arsD [Clostridia bacterium]